MPQMSSTAKTDKPISATSNIKKDEETIPAMSNTDPKLIAQNK
jgi:hypothetical protein